jgi:hypothetical protein
MLKQFRLKLAEIGLHGKVGAGQMNGFFQIQFGGFHRVIFHRN